MLKWALVTAADTRYFSLLKDWLRSIRNHPALDDADLWVLDVGLTPDEIEWVKTNGAKITTVDWEVDFTGRDVVRPSFKAITARPFLPNHIRGYDVIMWLDADIWVQEPTFARLYYMAAERYGFAIAPELDRSYPIVYGDENAAKVMHHKVYYTCFDRRTADDLIRFPIMNSGAFAARGDHPIWREWQRVYREAIGRSPMAHAEQASLNVAIYSALKPPMQPHALPSLANWLCSMTKPMWNPTTKNFVHPNLPHETLGMIHLAGSRGKFQLSTTDGGTITTGLTYSDYEALRRDA